MFRFFPVEEESCIKWTLVGKLPEKYRKKFAFFSERYELSDVLVNIPYLIHPLKNKKERRCSFCGLSYPVVKFNKIAHAIPELIGNKHLFSDSECDNCNKIFSVYENDFAYSLGIMRSLLQTDTKSGIPTFKSPGKDFVIKEGLFKSKNQKVVVFESIGKNVKNFKVDKNAKTLSIMTKKQSYRPFNVFKTLLKIALSAVKQDEIEKFRPVLDLLIGKTDIETASNSAFNAFCYSIPGFTFPSPMVLLFKKVDHCDTMMTYTACIYFMNSIYQISLPGFLDDMWMYNGKQVISSPIAPPLIDESITNEFGLPTFYQLDLSSKELVKGEKSNVLLSFNSNQFFAGDPFEDDLVVK